MNCPICEGASHLSLNKDGYDYYQCNDCQFLFHRRELVEEIGSALPLYDQTYWEMERAEALRRERDQCFIRAVELVYLSTIRVENVLEFGSGLGITVKLLRDRLGLNAVGVDPHGEFSACDYLHKVEVHRLRDTYPEAYFDAIYSIEVFEHLESPASILTELSYLLKPQGKILINTGTQEYLDAYDPEKAYIDPSRRGHISIYSLKAFRALASKTGMTAHFLGDRKYEVILERQPPPNSRFPIDENLQTLAQIGDWFPSLIREYMRLVSLEEDFTIRGTWAHKLQSELRERDLSLARLQSEFEDRSRWALSLNKEVEDLRAQIAALKNRNS